MLSQVLGTGRPLSQIMAPSAYQVVWAPAAGHQLPSNTHSPTRMGTQFFSVSASLCLGVTFPKAEIFGGASLPHCWPELSCQASL